MVVPRVRTLRGRPQQQVEFSVSHAVSALHRAALPRPACFPIGCPQAQKGLGERDLRWQAIDHAFLITIGKEIG